MPESRTPSEKLPNASHLLEAALVPIPEGSIKLVDHRTGAHQTVPIDGFLLGSIPVTQALYHSVVGTNPSAFSGEAHPVEMVSWMDAVQFCNRLSARDGLEPYYRLADDPDHVVGIPHCNGYRLPSEAEWQFACQEGKDQTRYGALEKTAWYKDNSDGSTHPVGQKTANAFGLHDMLGNVWEWCSNVYDNTVYGSYRVFKGGGWADEAWSVMASTRRKSHPNSFRIDDLGFRVARSLPKSTH